MNPGAVPLGDYWGVSLAGIWRGGRILLDPWSIDRQHQFNVWVAELFGGPVVSTLIALLPSLRAAGSDRLQLAQVALMEKGAMIERGLQRAIESNDSLSVLLYGVSVTQSGEAKPLQEPHEGPVPTFGRSTVQEPESPRIEVSVPLWEKGVARKDAVFNTALADVWSLYNLVWGVIGENLFPLDPGQRALRDSLWQSNQGWRLAVHVQARVGDPKDLMEAMVKAVSPKPPTPPTHVQAPPQVHTPVAPVAPATTAGTPVPRVLTP